MPNKRWTSASSSSSSFSFLFKPCTISNKCKLVEVMTSFITWCPDLRFQKKMASERQQFILSLSLSLSALPVFSPLTIRPHQNWALPLRSATVKQNFLFVCVHGRSEEHGGRWVHTTNINSSRFAIATKPTFPKVAGDKCRQHPVSERYTCQTESGPWWCAHRLYYLPPFKNKRARAHTHTHTQQNKKHPYWDYFGADEKRIFADPWHVQNNPQTFRLISTFIH